MKAKRILFAGCLACFGVVPVLSLSAPSGTGDRKIELNVPQGTSAYQVALELKEHDIISSTRFFRLYLRLSGRSSSIQTGTYELHDGMWMSEIAHALSSGKVKLSSLTIPEGWNHRQIGNFLAAKGLVENRAEFLDISRDPVLLRRYNILDPSTEGYLYPETYKIPEHYTAAALHKLMLAKFFRVIEELGSGKYSPEDLRQRVILASIVEREARHAHERPIIARIFLNRLAKQMKLESCATVQYLFERSKPKLYLRDLARPSPYNTYIHYGMPPGPISNPGKAALKAAFRPQKNKYLYFVVKPDGSHHFSATYREHILAKKKYIDSDLVVTN